MNSNAERDATSSEGGVPIRVAVVGGYTLVRDSIRALVAQHGHRDVLGERDTRRDAVAADAPDVVVLDLDTAHPDAMSLLHQTRGSWPNAHVIVLTARCDPDHAEEYVLAGASGVLTKDRPGEHLALAIGKVNAGEVWLGRAPMAHLIAELAWNPHAAPTDPEHDHIASLTARERDVIGLVSAGLNNKAIASSLGISENTVRHHLTSVFGKLDVPDRLALAVYAFRHALATSRDP